MNYILCRNRVRNFDYWKGVFDSHADAHDKAGLKLVHMWYELKSPRNVFFLFQAEDAERAREFLDGADGDDALHESGLIEGDFHVFSDSLGYGPLSDEQSRAFAAASADTDPSRPMNSGSSPETVNDPDPAKNPELEKSATVAEPAQTAEPETAPTAVATPATAEPEKSPTLVEPARITEHEESPAPAEAMNTTAPAKPSLPPMKGLERVKSVQPAEPFEGFQPVENWPPAEAAAEPEPQATAEVPRPRGRWVRMKY